MGALYGSVGTNSNLLASYYDVGAVEKGHHYYHFRRLDATQIQSSSLDVVINLDVNDLKDAVVVGVVVHG